MKQLTIQRTIGSVAVIALMGVLVAGCTDTKTDPKATTTTTVSPSAEATSASASPVPTATAKETVVAPTSPTAAIAGASEVAISYWKMEDEIFADGGRNAERIVAVSTGKAAKATVASAKVQREKKITFTGQRRLTVMSGYATDITYEVKGKKSTVKSGSVQLKACNDVSGVTGKNADGSAATN